MNKKEENHKENQPIEAFFEALAPYYIDRMKMFRLFNKEIEKGYVPVTEKEQSDIDRRIETYYKTHITPKAIETGIKVQGPREDAYLITKSARIGVPYQITFVDQNGPYGHADKYSVKEIIKTLDLECGEIIQDDFSHINN